MPLDSPLLATYDHILGFWRSIDETYHPFDNAANNRWAAKHPVHFVALVLVVIASTKVHKWAPWAWRQWAERGVITFTWPMPEEAGANWTGKVIPKAHLVSHLEDSSLLPASVGEKGEDSLLTCFDPSTGYHLTTLTLASSSEISAQMKRARDAQPAWARTTFRQRRRVLKSLKGWVLRDMEGICRVACRDTGKTRVDAVFGEILTTLSKIDWLLQYGEPTLSPNRRSNPLALSHKITKVHYEPLGTTLACVSWNYSFHNFISPVLASLFAGNSCVVKVSEQVAWSSLWYLGGVRACLKACGVDDEVVQVIVCLPEMADEVTRNPLVDHIIFIGSEPVGRKVAAAAADIMVPTTIELGGKDPAFIIPNTNVDLFVSTWLRGSFQSMGQNCIGIELILVHRSNYDQLLSALQSRVRAIRIGTDVGSLISHASIPKTQRLLDSAVASGARILVGGKPYVHPQHPDGAWYEPTLLVGVRMDMDIAQEEVFGPVMSVVPYDHVSEAVQWLNESPYGLGAGVYGERYGECEQIARQLKCGMVAINDFAVFYLNQAAPFGGVKASGHGRFGGEEGLRSLCSTKTIIEDRFFSWVRTSIPKVVDYPLPSGEVSWDFLHGLTQMAHGLSIGARIQGLVELIINAIRA